MATRRQAPKLSKQDYEVYAEDLLHYEMVDIETACLQIGRAERTREETAFPSVATLISAIKFAGGKRRDAERDQRRKDEEAQYLEQVNRERAEDGLPPYGVTA